MGKSRNHKKRSERPQYLEAGWYVRGIEDPVVCLRECTHPDQEQPLLQGEELRMLLTTLETRRNERLGATAIADLTTS